MENIVKIKTSSKEEDKKQTGLMKQTKAQLIDIILRKDDVEKLKQAEIDALTDELTEKDNRINGLISDCEGMQRALDDAASDLASANEHIKSLSDRYRIAEETIANLKKNSKSSKPVAIAYTIVVISVIFACVCCYFAFMQ